MKIQKIKMPEVWKNGIAERIMAKIVWDKDWQWAVKSKNVDAGEDFATESYKNELRNK